MARPLWLVVVFSRWPAPGRCKRRLAASIGPQAAASIQAQLLRHVLAVLHPLASSGLADLHLATSGAENRAWQRWLHAMAAPDLVISVGAQGTGQLGCRMAKQVRRGLVRGYRGVVLLGSDCLGLETSDLHRALQLLDRDERGLVLGSARDGGYWLMGLRHFEAALFCGISWGGSNVGAETERRGRAAGLQLHKLRQHGDLDRVADLRPWIGAPRPSLNSSASTAGRCTSAGHPHWWCW